MLGFSIPELGQRQTEASEFPVTISLLGPSLHPGIQVTQASEATRIDASGNITVIAPNAPRFDHDPNTGLVKGLLAEPSATNLVHYAVASLPEWSNLLCTLTQLTENALGSFPGVRAASGGETWHRTNVSTGGWTAAKPIRIKVWYVSGSSGQAIIVMRNSTASVESALTGTTGNLAPSVSTAGAITDVVNSTIGAVHVVEFTVTPSDNATSGTLGIGPYSATTGDDIIVLGAQVEASTEASSLILSNGAETTRQADQIILNDWSGVYDLEIRYADSPTETRSGITLAPGHQLPPLAGQRIQSLKIS
ncbi:hypothetical protein DL239_19150 [Sedimentitalea sp. CY04]|uniref:Uncharacterized protein n=1 Tax=Parasedimentitalea denitrificans TaxID=2211118 RepID=A0ABX0WE08_9RHOB|nr:hypothetical protein [Sedimentitalea sp. CY04]NIZ63088.1 hypothetical protein [Sedimentitalea sp. CY04]